MITAITNINKITNISVTPICVNVFIPLEGVKVTSVFCIFSYSLAVSFIFLLEKSSCESLKMDIVSRFSALSNISFTICV